MLDQMDSYEKKVRNSLNADAGAAFVYRFIFLSLLTRLI